LHDKLSPGIVNGTLQNCGVSRQNPPWNRKGVEGAGKILTMPGPFRFNEHSRFAAAADSLVVRAAARRFAGERLFDLGRLPRI
jgi:hypothetical protein